MTAEDRLVVVVGGASGIGEATVRTLAEDGWVIAILDLAEDRARAIATDLQENGGSVLALRCDVQSSADIDGAIRRVVDDLSRIDALVTCAGVFDPGPSDAITDAGLLRMLDIHLCGTIRCARAAFPYLRNSPDPAIVAVSSVAAHIGIPHRLSYCAAKGGIEAVARTLAVEWGAYGIRCNAVAPAWVRTPAIADAIESGSIDERPLRSLVPLARLAELREVADVIAFLLSRKASYITGQSIIVDGALTVRGPWPQGVDPPTPHAGNA